MGGREVGELGGAGALEGRILVAQVRHDLRVRLAVVEQLAYRFADGDRVAGVLVGDAGVTQVFEEILIVVDVRVGQRGQPDHRSDAAEPQEKSHTGDDPPKPGGK